ncbi:hypothetical protein L227DRAFT_47230 [Lentinus tigrinus ALCF2SS1-6]|uniref:Uncharacterized protein n=1 Tax=Lentinus tigrinus ALCF2SS1-6 TaxID=1328759 RepID=A0A5C2SE19_9APHY|nr:hypothetical protein L227DRAFT_47230 [Lentinus tigrinus ALCF2SS1-6]
MFGVYLMIQNERQFRDGTVRDQRKDRTTAASQEDLSLATRRRMRWQANAGANAGARTEPCKYSPTSSTRPLPTPLLWPHVAALLGRRHHFTLFDSSSSTLRDQISSPPRGMSEAACLLSLCNAVTSRANRGLDSRRERVHAPSSRIRPEIYPQSR